MSDRIPLTAIISTKNEELAIRKCLAGLSQFDQIIVVDSMSTDRTVEFAKAAGAEVVSFDWNREYPKKKQWCLENLQIENDWVLFIDADESPTPELREEIARIAAGPNSATRAYDVPLEYHFGGRELRHGHQVSKRVLLRKNYVHFPVVDDLEAPGMGELEGHYQPEVNGPIGTTKAKLRHDDPDPIATWIGRHNKYSDWEAYVRVHSTARSAVRAHKTRQGKLFDRVPLKPLAFFLYSFVLKRGFLDGRAGFDYAAGLAWYYWLIDLKVRESAAR